MKTQQVFVSHSSKDNDKIGFFNAFFRDTNIKPVFMEFEQWSRDFKPNWQWIKKEIRRSKALFLILTEKIIEKNYTQNWIAYEIGVAANCSPSLPVFVFKEENVDFPVPYLTWYFDEPVTSLEYLKPDDFSELFLDFLVVNIKYLVLYDTIFETVFDPSRSDKNNEWLQKCDNCYLYFNYFGASERIHCPCCSRWIELKNHE